METTFLVYCLIALSVLILSTIVAFVLYSGLFITLNVGAGPPPIKSVKIVYKFGRGPYKDTGYYFTEVTSLAPKQKCVGIYYDDPKQVESTRLRWAVGCIVSETGDSDNEELVTLLKTRGYKMFTFPEVSNVVKCTFPHNTFLSIFIGIFRVYPLMGEYVRVNKLCAHPWMEIYDGPNIHYLAPLARQDEFYVPEANEEEELEEQIEDEKNEESSVTCTSGIKEEVKDDGSDKPDILLSKTVPDSKPGKNTNSEISTAKKEKCKNDEESENETDAESKTAVTNEENIKLEKNEKKSKPKVMHILDGVASGEKTCEVQDSDISSSTSLCVTTDNVTTSKSSPASPTNSDLSMTISDSSLLTSGTDVSSCKSTTTEESSYISTDLDASQSALSGFSSDSDTEAEPFEVIKKEDTQ